MYDVFNFNSSTGLKKKLAKKEIKEAELTVTQKTTDKTPEEIEKGMNGFFAINTNPHILKISIMLWTNAI